MMEVDAFEMAIEESKTTTEGSWMDLLSKKYLNRTLVSGNECL